MKVYNKRTYILIECKVIVSTVLTNIDVLAHILFKALYIREEENVYTRLPCVLTKGADVCPCLEVDMSCALLKYISFLQLKLLTRFNSSVPCLMVLILFVHMDTGTFCYEVEHKLVNKLWLANCWGNLILCWLWLHRIHSTEFQGSCNYMTIYKNVYKVVYSPEILLDFPWNFVPWRRFWNCLKVPFDTQSFLYLVLPTI